MNSLLFATNTASQALTNGQTLSFGQPVRRYGKNIQLSGGNVIISGEGYYPMIAGVTFTSSDAGVYTVQLFENGVPITGAKASLTVAANVIVAVAIPATVRIKCCEEKTITASVSGADSTVTNADIVVTKA